MLRRKFLTQLLMFNVLVVCALIPALAQKTAADKNTLAKFEKSIEQGSYAGIERDLLNYAISNPNDAKGFELLARIRFAQNRLNEAKSLYQKALSLDNNLTSAKINLAIINFQTGNISQINTALNEISDGEISDDTVRMNLANAFVIVGDCQKALTVIEKLGTKIKNGEALPLRAECYLKSNDKQKVDALISPAISIAGQNPATAIKFAEILSNAGMYKESANILRSVVKLFQQNADALILLAKSEIYLKNLENAKIHINQASKINPDSTNLILVQSLFESEQGNAAESLSLIEKALSENPNSAEILSRYVLAAIRANQAKKAVKAAEKLLQLNADEPEFLYLSGAASLQNNNLQTAESFLHRFVELRPNDSRGCFALGLTFAAQPEKLEDARRQLRHCLEINPNNFEAKYQLGLSYKSQGETAKAIEYLEAAVKDSPDFALALRDLGAVYLLSGAEAKAKIVLEKSVAINPKDADTHFQLSRLYSLIGETALGKKHLGIFQSLRNPKKDGM